MKVLIQIAIISLISIQIHAQTDNNGNPIFNSVSTDEREFKNCLLISNYYTLSNNIENKLSSVFISESPSLDEVENAAKQLPSDFFILTKESKMVAMIMIQEYPKREFMTMVMSSNKQDFYKCELEGDISENRANELIQENYDSTATMKNGILTFNNTEFKIITNEEIDKAIEELIEKNKLHKKTPSEIVMPSKNQLKEFVIEGTKEGNQLDFFTEIQGQENDGIQVKPGVFSTKLGIALYKWGRACFDIGVNTVKDAYEIFAEIRGRELNRKEREYIKLGFYKELEK